MKNAIVLSFIFSFYVCCSTLQAGQGPSTMVREGVQNEILHQHSVFPLEDHTNEAGLELLSRSQAPVGRARAQRATMVSISAMPIEERTNEEERALKTIIPGEDGRVQVTATDEWPASVHGAVYVRFPSSMPDTYEWGTGVLIAPNIVLTAAHNLYDRRRCEEVTEVRFFPGINGRDLPFGESRVIHWHFPREYLETGVEDYAILALESALGEDTGYFGIGVIPSIFIEQERSPDYTISITGYPKDKVTDRDRYYEMWGMQGPIKRIDEDFITYEIDTSNGQSGSGVCCQIGEIHYVVGLHVAWDRALGVNKAIRFTQARLEKMEGWIKDSMRGRLKEVVFRDIQVVGLECSLRRLPIVDNLGVALDELCEYKLPNLTELNLSGHWFRFDVERIRTICRNFTNLTELNLGRNRIKYSSIEALSSLTALVKLDLSGIKLGRGGAQTVARVFTNLKNLRLNRSRLGDAGVRALIGTLSINRTLQALDLGNNDIGNAGVADIGRMLRVNTVLRTLNLSWNRFDSTGAKSLAEGLMANRILRALILSQSEIDFLGDRAAGEVRSRRIFLARRCLVFHRDEMMSRLFDEVVARSVS